MIAGPPGPRLIQQIGELGGIKLAPASERSFHASDLPHGPAPSVLLRLKIVGKVESDMRTSHFAVGR
jgi:hypothetical protein